MLQLHAQLNRNATSILREVQSEHRDKEPSERHAQERKGCGQGHLPQLRNLSLPYRKGLTALSNHRSFPRYFSSLRLLVEPFNWNRQTPLRENRGQGHLRLSARSNHLFGIKCPPDGDRSSLDTSARILPRGFRHAQFSASLRPMCYLCNQYYSIPYFLFASYSSAKCGNCKWPHHLLSTDRLEGQYLQYCPRHSRRSLQLSLSWAEQLDQHEFHSSATNLPRSLKHHYRYTYVINSANRIILNCNRTRRDFRPSKCSNRVTMGLKYRSVASNRAHVGLSRPISR